MVLAENHLPFMIRSQVVSRCPHFARIWLACTQNYICKTTTTAGIFTCKTNGLQWIDKISEVSMPFVLFIYLFIFFIVCWKNSRLPFYSLWSWRRTLKWIGINSLNFLHNNWTIMKKSDKDCSMWNSSLLTQPYIQVEVKNDKIF